MTIIGTAELDVRAVGQNFNADLNRVVQPGLNKAGTEMERTATRGRVAFGAMWGAFGAQSQGALGPVANVISQIQTAAAAIGRNSSIAAKAMATGFVGAGIGVGLQALGSGEVAAQGQLKLSIENLGHSYDDYEGRIQKTIKTGEHYGQTAEQTMRVLNQLTIATKDPAKAMNDYQIVLNLAAVRHVPVTTAARMLSMVYAGNSRALRALGINITDQTKAVAASTEADKKHAEAQKAVVKARQNLKDVEARLGASRQGHVATAAQLASAEARVASATSATELAAFKHGKASPQYAAAAARLTAAEAGLTKVRQAGTGPMALTVSQQIELRKAHEALKTAQDNLTGSTAKMTQAHKDAAGAAHGADDAVKQLADRVRNQADPAAATFSGHLHAYWAMAEDDLARFGAKWGGTVTAISTGVLGVGTLLEGGRAIFGRFADSGTTAATTVEKDLAGMQSSGSMSMGRLAGAVAGVALAIGTVEVGRATAGSGAAGAIGTSLMGAVSGAAIGLSVGGPFGAAVGGAVGALAGLALHFQDAAAQADALNKATQTWMTTALQADNFALGQQFNQGILDMLKKNPAAAAALAASGVKVGDIAATVRGGSAFGGPAGTALQSAVRTGKISQDDYAKAVAALQLLVDNFAAIVGNVDDIATISGQVSQHTTDLANETKTLAGLIGLQPKGPGKSSGPPTLASLLTPPRGHRAAGGPVDAFSSYLVGEHGPEWLQMGSSAGYVHPNGSTAGGWDGAAILQQLGGMRMDLLQLVHAARSTTRAAEDLPHGIVRVQAQRGDRAWGSPELATL